MILNEMLHIAFGCIFHSGRERYYAHYTTLRSRKRIMTVCYSEQ